MTHFIEHGHDAQDMNDDLLEKINFEAISTIEKVLEPCDIISLVFLLYNIPDTALQRLVIYERISKDDNQLDLNLLHDWAVDACRRPTWKQEFVEALTICQLYRILHKKLQFDVTTIKNLFKPDELQYSVYINAVKKILYKLAENITSENLTILQKTLQTYNIDTTEYCYTEEILLKLMSEKFISVPSLNNGFEKETMVKMDNLIEIIETFPELKFFVKELRETSAKLNNVSTETNKDRNNAKKYLLNEPSTSTSVDNNKILDIGPINYDSIFNKLNDMEHTDISGWESDHTKISKDVYPIKNPKRIGFCYIINQESFYPSETSIKNKCAKLDRRTGTTQDKIVLTKTMESLNFHVESDDNLNNNEIFDKLKAQIKYKFWKDDSIFMLCILSHGVKDHVYSSDSIKVSVEKIKELLDSDEFPELSDIPKLLIIQACQINDEQISPTLVADSAEPDFKLKKKNFLDFWATAPELEAFRDMKQGSIFIQKLCTIIKDNYKQKHFLDICTKVNRSVEEKCTDIKKVQVSMFKSTLVKDLYFYLPK